MTAGDGDPRTGPDDHASTAGDDDPRTGPDDHASTAGDDDPRTGPDESTPPAAGEVTPTDPDYPTEEAPSATVQLLIDDEGNRSVIAEMIEGTVAVESGESVTDADLYVIEDRLVARHREALERIVAEADPVFRPVLVVTRSTTDRSVLLDDPEPGDGPLLVDETIDAPIDRATLLRRVRSLLVRRRQSLSLECTVDELRERERSLRRFEGAVRESANAIVILDRDGTVDVANPAVESLTGRGRESILGEPLEGIEPVDHTSFEPTFWRTLETTGEWEGEVVVTRPDGSRRIADATVTAIAGTGGRRTEGFVLVFSDITDRISREESLRRRETELELLREILTRYLRHNVRNELNVITGYAQLLADGTDEGDIERWTSAILDQADRLLETSETARRYSDLIDRSDELVDRDLVTTIEAVVDRVADRHPNARLSVDAPDSCPIHAADGLVAGLEELVENAVAHHDDERPRVDVRLRVGEGIRLVVADDGPGIPPEELTALERRRETPLVHASGVGLWLARWAVERHGGTLTFDTGSDGTRAIVELPRRIDHGDGVAITSVREREGRLKRLIDRMTDAIMEVDADWHVTFVDERAARILDIDPGSVVDRPFWEVFPDARDTRFEEVYREAMGDRNSRSVRAHYPGIDGWLEVYVYPDFAGGLSFYFRDVTDEHEREEALYRRSQAIAAAPIGITLSDPARTDNPIVYANDAFERVTGYEPRDIVGRNCRILQGPDTDEAAVDEMRAAIADEEPVAVELLNYRKDGTPFRNRVTIAPVHDASGDLVSFVGFQEDVTAERERGAELDRQRTRLQALYDNSPDMVDVLDLEGRIVDANDRFCEELGHDREAILGRGIWEFDVLVTESEVREQLAGLDPGERRRFEGRYRRADGSTLPVEVHLVRVGVDDEDRVVAISRDRTAALATEREQEATIALLETLLEIATDREAAFEEKLADLLEAGTDALELAYGFLTRIEGEEGDGVQTVVEATGDHDLLQAGERCPLAESYCRRTIEAGGFLAIPDALEAGWADDPAYGTFGLESYVGTEVVVDGETFGTLCFAASAPREAEFTDLERTVVRLIARWVGHELERLRVTEDLQRQNDRLEDLATTISHDLRNPLNVATSRLDLARETGDDDHLEDVEWALGRMETLIADILTLAREGGAVGELESVALDDVVADCWRAVDDEGSATLDVRTERVLRADRSRLQQLLENLFRNAVEHGGDDRAVTITVGDLADGFFVADDGPGIEREVRERLFQPGVSTRDDGTGFGLAIVREITEAHGWTVRATDGPDGGARFEVTGVTTVPDDGED